MPKPYYQVDSAEPAKSVAYLIRRCGLLISQLAEQRFVAQRISFTQCLVLVRLRFQSTVSISQLSDELGHDMGALSRAVDTLARSGLVRRSRSRHDRRAVDISLTVAGRQRMESCLRAQVELLNDIVQPLSRDEIEQFHSLLQGTLGRLRALVHDDSQSPRLTEKRGAANRRHRIRGTSASGDRT